MKEKLYTCEGCGFKVFTSDHQICPICRYHNSIGSLLYPNKEASNGEKTLLDFQAWTMENIPFSRTSFEDSNTTYYRDIYWRPINFLKLDTSKEYFPEYFLNQISKKNKKYFNQSKNRFFEAQKFNPDEKVHLESY